MEWFAALSCRRPGGSNITICKLVAPDRFAAEGKGLAIARKLWPPGEGYMAHFANVISADSPVIEPESACWSKESWSVTT